MKTRITGACAPVGRLPLRRILGALIVAWGAALTAGNLVDDYGARLAEGMRSVIAPDQQGIPTSAPAPVRPIAPQLEA